MKQICAHQQILIQSLVMTSRELLQDQNYRRDLRKILQRVLRYLNEVNPSGEYLGTRSWFGLDPTLQCRVLRILRREGGKYGREIFCVAGDFNEELELVEMLAGIYRVVQPTLLVRQNGVGCNSLREYVHRLANVYDEIDNLREELGLGPWECFLR